MYPRPQEILPVKNRKNERHHWIFHTRISLSTKFQLKLTILIFWTKFTQNWYSESQTEKVNTTIKLCIFWLVWVSNFSSNWQFWCFGRNLPPKRHFQSKMAKVNTTIEFCISKLGTKFQLKLTILIFWTKFFQKGYFWLKSEKVNMTIEFCIFELAWIPNFSLD